MNRSGRKHENTKGHRGSVAANLFRLGRYLRPYWRRQLAALFFLLAGTAASLLIPLLIKDLLDTALPGKDQALLVRIIVKMAGLQLFVVVCMLATDYFFLKVSNGIILDMRRDLNDKLLGLSMDYFERTKTGQIMARIMGDVDSVQTLTTNSFLMLLTDSFAVLLMLGFMFYLSSDITLICLGTLLALVIVFRYFNARLAGAARASREMYGRISEEVQETISGVREIKAFTYESLKGKHFLETLLNYYRADFRRGIIGSFSHQTGMLVMAIGPVIVYFYGGLGVIQGRFTIGLLVAFFVYLTRMYASAQRLTFLNIQAQSAMGAVERIFDFLDTEPAVREAGDAIPVPEAGGEIVLDGVTFRYGGDGAPEVLRDVSLRLRPGERVALVGASGAGKSTVANLICRFYDVRKGRVLLDGSEIGRYRIGDLRARIGIVPQDTFLFHASIADNLRLGNPEATREEIEAAAGLADADGFIAELPGGYDGIVGERGMKLSGGQKQRLAIARTILKNPRIVIFDEATSSLDAESERQVKRSMDRLMQGRTTLIVSHRLSTVADADRIVVLDKGRIVEEGTHASLIEQGGIYRALYEKQAADLAQSPNV